MTETKGALTVLVVIASVLAMTVAVTVYLKDEHVQPQPLVATNPPPPLSSWPSMEITSVYACQNPNN